MEGRAEMRAKGAAAAIALGLAGFARQHLVLLLPLAAFFLVDSAKPREILETDPPEIVALDPGRRRLWTSCWHSF